MAEAMKGLHRTHRCTEVTKSDIGTEVTLMGWAQKRRNLGSLIFVDLRDRSGIMQVVFDENDIGPEGFEKAGKIRSEYVLAVVGRVEKRGGAVNESLKTGELEIRATGLRILSESETPPFPIEEHIQTKDELRLKYRYLDLRRPNLQRNLMLRSKVAAAVRRFMDAEGFLEISAHNGPLKKRNASSSSSITGETGDALSSKCGPLSCSPAKWVISTRITPSMGALKRTVSASPPKVAPRS